MEKSKNENGDGATDECANAHVGSIAGVIAVDAAVHTSVFCPSAQRDYVAQSEREIWQRLWRAEMQRAHRDHMLRQLPPKHDPKK